VVLSGSLESIKESHHRLTLRYEQPPAGPPAFPGALSVSGSGREWSVLCNGSREALIQCAREAGATIAGEVTPTLDEIFVARAAAGKPSRGTP
jgi:ABC-2 type transport system ATP-binding protein